MLLRPYGHLALYVWFDAVSSFSTGRLSPAPHLALVRRCCVPRSPLALARSPASEGERCVRTMEFPGSEHAPPDAHTARGSRHPERPFASSFSLCSDASQSKRRTRCRCRRVAGSRKANHSWRRRACIAQPTGDRTADGPKYHSGGGCAPVVVTGGSPPPLPFTCRCCVRGFGAAVRHSRSRGSAVACRKRRIGPEAAQSQRLQRQQREAIGSHVGRCKARNGAVQQMDGWGRGRGGCYCIHSLTDILYCVDAGVFLLFCVVFFFAQAALRQRVNAQEIKLRALDSQQGAMDADGQSDTACADGATNDASSVGDRSVGRPPARPLTASSSARRLSISVGLRSPGSGPLLISPMQSPAVTPRSVSSTGSSPRVGEDERDDASRLYRLQAQVAQYRCVAGSGTTFVCARGCMCGGVVAGGGGGGGGD